MPLGSTFYHVSLLRSIISGDVRGRGGVGGEWPPYVTAIYTSQQAYIIEGCAQRQFCRARRAESFCQRKYFSATLTSVSKVEEKVTFNTFSIVKVFIFNFTINLLNGFENYLQFKDRAR